MGVENEISIKSGVHDILIFKYLYGLTHYFDYN